MQCNVTRQGGCIVITPEVPIIDASVAAPFREQLTQEIGELARAGISTPRVILDLHGVNFMDSSGLGAIISVRKTLGTQGDLRLVGVQPEVRSLFELTRLVRVLPLYEDLQQALAAG
jgi:anti-sigma B factor antagonist